MTQSPDIKISDAAKELSQQIADRIFVVEKRVDKNTVYLNSVTIIEQALTAAAAEGRRLALGEAANHCDNKYRVSGGGRNNHHTAKQCAITIRALTNTPASSPWQTMETAPRDGTPVLIRTTKGVVEGWYAPLEPSCDHEGKDNSWGDCWVCYDDIFEIEVQRCGDIYLDGEVTHWMPLPSAPNKPDGGE